MQNTFSIRDYGRGIPVDIHPIHNRPVLEILCTDMHAGGKLTAESNYKVSGGNYGIGLKVMNALSRETSYRILERWDITIHKILVKDLKHLIYKSQKRLKKQELL